jgi:hypothetical protein
MAEEKGGKGTGLAARDGGGGSNLGGRHLTVLHQRRKKME